MRQISLLEGDLPRKNEVRDLQKHVILTFIGITAYAVAFYIVCKGLTNHLSLTPYSLLVWLTSLLFLTPLTVALFVLIKFLVDTIRFLKAIRRR